MAKAVKLAGRPTGFCSSYSVSSSLPTGRGTETESVNSVPATETPAGTETELLICAQYVYGSPLQPAPSRFQCPAVQPSLRASKTADLRGNAAPGHFPLIASKGIPGASC